MTPYYKQFLGQDIATFYEHYINKNSRLLTLTAYVSYNTWDKPRPHLSDKKAHQNSRRLKLTANATQILSQDQQNLTKHQKTLFSTATFHKQISRRLTLTACSWLTGDIGFWEWSEFTSCGGWNCILSNGGRRFCTEKWKYWQLHWNRCWR